MFKFMIQAETAQELKNKILEAAAMYGETVVAPHKGTADLADKMKDYMEKNPPPPAMTATETQDRSQDLKDYMDKPSPEATPMTRIEKAEARIEAAFSPKVEPSTPPSTNFIDSRGVPWHPDFHSAAKSFNKDGSWRGQRGVLKVDIDKYESKYLRASPAKEPEITAEVTSPSQAWSPAQNQPAPWNAAPVPQQVQQEVAPPPPVPVAAPAWEAAPTPMVQQGKPTHSLQTFKSNIPMVIAELHRQGKVDANWMQSVFAYYNIKGVEHIIHNDQIADDLFKQMISQGLINGV